MSQHRLKILTCLMVVFAICLMNLSERAGAAEQILSFFSDVNVRANGVLNVEETITVVAERRHIRRGIYRDFPVRYLQASGLWRHVGFKLLEVTRNGRPEPYKTERRGNYLRIYIGNEKKYIPSGVHRYTIKYNTSRQIRYFKEFDEIYWNATGNFWRFPIVKAQARITLPDGAHIMRKAGYTGYSGARGSDYEVSEESTRSIVFTSTRQFRRREGLSVAVAFPKGIVAQPSQAEILLLRLWDNIGLIVLMLGTLLTLIYFIITWHRIGRDPQQGLIIPRFKPPDGLSPAVVSYIHFWGFKTNSSTPLSFIAGLISLAVKGIVKIDMGQDKKIIVERLQPATSADQQEGRKLPPGERVIEKNLLGTADKIIFNKSNGAKLKNTLSSFKRAILREYEGDFFRNNYLYLTKGAVIGLLSLIAYFVLNPPTDSQLGALMLIFASGIIGSFLLFPGLERLFSGRKGILSLLLGTLMTLIGSIILILVILSPVVMAGNLSIAAPFAAGTLAIMNVGFFYLLRAPTLTGRTVMDHIEGFKLYLTIAEAERMNLVDAPDMSTELYENFLPYAIGLGVEKPWSNAFASHMKRATSAGQSRGYHPAWYSGRSFDSGNLAASTSAIASSIASSAASAMPSSSGSGGGGFSGGGGGGGGGGGW